MNHRQEKLVFLVGMFSLIFDNFDNSHASINIFFLMLNLWENKVL